METINAGNVMRSLQVKATSMATFLAVTRPGKLDRKAISIILNGGQLMVKYHILTTHNCHDV